MPTDYEHLRIAGGVLAAARGRAWLEKAEMARRLGMNHSYISRVESGMQKPSQRLVEGYEQVLGLPAGSLQAKVRAALLGLGTGAMVAPDAGVTMRTRLDVSPSVGPHIGVSVRWELEFLRSGFHALGGLVGEVWRDSAAGNFRTPPYVRFEPVSDPIRALLFTLNVDAEDVGDSETSQSYIVSRTNMTSVFFFPLPGAYMSQLQLRLAHPDEGGPAIASVQAVTVPVERAAGSSRGHGLVEWIEISVGEAYMINDPSLGLAYGLEWTMEK